MTGLPFFILGINFQIIILKLNNNIKMKKFLAIALIAASFVACNDAKKEETTTTTSDTTTTTTVTPAPADTTVKTTVTDTTVKTTTTVDSTKH
jgi:hypothetical protein